MATSYKEFIEALTKAGAFGRQANANPEVLDAAELNLGASIEMPPANTTGTVQIPQPKRLLALNGPGNKARDVTIVMGQYISDPGAASQFATWGPMTGIVEFGSGSAFSVIEFDIPEPSQTPVSSLFNFFGFNFALTKTFASRPQNYASVTVCGSSIRVYARNDATYPMLWNPSYPVCTPMLRLGSQPYVVNASFDRTVPSVSSFVSYGQVLGANVASRLKKSVLLIGRKADGSANYWLPSTSLSVGIPPYASRVSFPRFPVATNLKLLLLSYQTASIRELFINSGEEGDIEINPSDSVLYLTNISDTSISDCKAVFSLTV